MSVCGPTRHRPPVSTVVSATRRICPTVSRGSAATFIHDSSIVPALTHAARAIVTSTSQTHKAHPILRGPALDLRTTAYGCTLVPADHLPLSRGVLPHTAVLRHGHLDDAAICQTAYAAGGRACDRKHLALLLALLLAHLRCRRDLVSTGAIAGRDCFRFASSPTCATPKQTSAPGGWLRRRVPGSASSQLLHTPSSEPARNARPASPYHESAQAPPSVDCTPVAKGAASSFDRA